MAGDDFEAFFAARAQALLSEISSAMGKPIEDLDLTGETDESYTSDETDEV